jgi:hypothetical protein
MIAVENPGGTRRGRSQVRSSRPRPEREATDGVGEPGSAALRADIVERTSRLGRQRDDTAREADGAEQEAAAANQQVKRELAAAEKFDKEAAAVERKAAVLERNAQNSATAEGEAADLREQAADERAFADAARQRSHDAEQAHDRLELRRGRESIA